MALTVPTSKLATQTVSSSFDQLLYLDATAGIEEATLKIVSAELGHSALQIAAEKVLVKSTDTNQATAFEVKQADDTTILSVNATTVGATLIGTLTVGANDTGHDVKFFGATSGQYMLWDEGADELVLAGDTKLSFHDAAGGENIIATSDGHLEINAGTTLDITAPTVDLNSATEFNIDTAAYDLNASGDVALDSAGNINLTSTVDEANSIYIHENAGTSGTIKIHADQGTGADSISLVSDVGGITMTLGGGAGDDFIVDTTTLVVESDNNRVGIGTAAPQYPLNVSGSAGLVEGNSLVWHEAGTTNVSGSINCTSSNIITIQTAGVTAMTIDESQDVGIGIATPDALLHLDIATAAIATPHIKLTETDDAREASIWNDAGDLYLATNNADHSIDAQIRMNTGGTIVLTGGTEVEQGSTGGAVAFKIDNDDTDQIAMSIEAANIDANVMAITADAVTTSHVIDVTADALTSGSMLYLDDNSPSTTARNCVSIIQNNAAAYEATALVVQSNAGGVGMKIDKNYPASLVAADTIIGLHVDFDHTVPSSGTATQTDIGIDLDVNSATLGTSTTYGMDICVVGATSGTHKAVGLTVGVSGADTNYAALFNGGNVGIGTQSPASPLHVSSSQDGDVVATFQNTHATGDGISIRLGATSLSTSEFFIYFLDSAGNVEGSISGDGNDPEIAVNGTSDRRLKENIIDIPDAMSIISQIKPRTFKWKDRGSDTNPRYGFIADEWFDVFPDNVIGQRDSDGKLIPDAMTTNVDGVEVIDRQMISTQVIIPVLVKSIQELSAEVDKLKNGGDA